MAAHRCSSFAQEQLAKHGWKKGQGLGRTESGISEAIKVKLKHDTAGVGHDLAEQFTYHWWDDVFNKAANNIIVENDDKDGVRLTRKENNQGLITNKKLSKARGKKPLLYGNFVRSGTLNPDKDKSSSSSSSSSSEDEDGAKDKANIDEKFFKACGGRTAHKGARHGLTLSGKLRRIQAQDDYHSQHHSSKNSTTTVTSHQQQTAHHQKLRDDGAQDGLPGKKRHKKHKRRKQEEELCRDQSTGSNVNSDITEERNSHLTNCDEKRKKPKKKSKRRKEDNLNNPDYATDEVAKLNNSDVVVRTSSSKKKRIKEDKKL